MSQIKTTTHQYKALGWGLSQARHLLDASAWFPSEQLLSYEVDI